MNSLSRSCLISRKEKKVACSINKYYKRKEKYANNMHQKLGQDFLFNLPKQIEIQPMNSKKFFRKSIFWNRIIKNP